MLGRWLVRTFVDRPDDTASSHSRAQYGKLEGWVSVAVNLVVFVAKLVPGLVVGSIALIADAFHSLGDVASSAVVIWGFTLAEKPSDREHPFGHGRIESIASLVVALLLVLTAWEFGKASVGRLFHPHPVTAPWWLLILLLATLLAKEWLARFSLAVGRRIASNVILGDFWHHRSDVLATAVVMAALVGSRLGLPWVDGVGGVVVSGFIAWAAYALVRDSVDPLIGEAPSPELLEEMRALALSVPGVEAVHDLIVHRYGGLLVASLHVEVSAKLDIAQGHDIAEAVEARLNERMAGWSVVHVDPVDREHPLWEPIRAFLDAEMARLPGRPTYHDLRIAGGEPCYVIFDLNTNGDPPPTLVPDLAARIRRAFPTVAKVQILLEPRYVY